MDVRTLVCKNMRIVPNKRYLWSLSQVYIVNCGESLVFKSLGLLIFSCVCILKKIYITINFNKCYSQDILKLTNHFKGLIQLLLNKFSTAVAVAANLLLARAHEAYWGWHSSPGSALQAVTQETHQVWDGHCRSEEIKLFRTGP